MGLLIEKISERLFTHIEIWLQSGVIAPKTTSLLERVFREIGRRLKRIAWGWSDRVATKLSKMILLKQYSRKDWEQYWMSKLEIVGCFQIEIASVTMLGTHRKNSRTITNFIDHLQKSW